MSDTVVDTTGEIVKPKVMLVCGEYRHPITDGYPVMGRSDHFLGLWMMGNGDLFDAGFTVENLERHGLKVMVNDVTVMVIQSGRTSLNKLVEDCR